MGFVKPVPIESENEIRLWPRSRLIYHGLNDSTRNMRPVIKMFKINILPRQAGQLRKYTFFILSVQADRL